MAELWLLFITFLKIGAFTFGGGYAMIPLITNAVMQHQWLGEMCIRDRGTLLGRHDFAAFAASGSVVKDTTREIYFAQLQKRGDLLVLDIVGSGFLYNMVRIIAGTLIDIGLSLIHI